MTSRSGTVVLLLTSSLTVLGVAALTAWPSRVFAATQPQLGTAANFAAMAGSTVTNTGPTVINGELALDPGTSVTGFPPGTSGTQEVHDAVSLQAQKDLGTAYTDAATATSTSDLSGKDLGGMNLTPGVYSYTSSAQLTGPLTLSGNGVFIFQVASTLTTASGSSVLLTNGAQACAVYWQVGSSATLGTATTFQGNLMAQTSITMVTGASIITGRALAETGALTMDDNRITPPSGTCTLAAPVTPTPTTTVTASPVSSTPQSTPPTPSVGSGLLAPGAVGAGVALLLAGGAFLGVGRRRPRDIP